MPHTTTRKGEEKTHRKKTRAQKFLSNVLATATVIAFDEQCYALAISLSE